MRPSNISAPSSTRKRTVAAGVAVAALALSGCGSSTAGTASPATTASSTATTTSAAALYTAAKKEGTVEWYTTFATKDIAKTIAAFNQKYPGVTVKALRLTGSQIPPRIATEQRGGKYVADVVSGDAPEIDELIHSNELMPFNPPDQAPLPAGLNLPSGYTGVTYVLTDVVAYNPSAVKAAGLQPPTSWQDLTKPQWKGKFSVDPGALDWYLSLIAAKGHQQALQLVKALGNNNPTLVTSHTLALTQVEAGEPLAAATAYGYKAASIKAKNSQHMAFVNPNPLPAELNLIDVVKNAPHPAAAKLFEDWVVSQAGQQAIVKITNHTSLRSDVNNDKTVWDPSTWKPAWSNPNITAAEYNSDFSELKSALHTTNS